MKTWTEKYVYKIKKTALLIFAKTDERVTLSTFIKRPIKSVLSKRQGKVKFWHTYTYCPILVSTIQNNLKLRDNIELANRIFWPKHEFFLLMKIKYFDSYEILKRKLILSISVMIYVDLIITDSLFRKSFSVLIYPLKAYILPFSCFLLINSSFYQIADSCEKFSVNQSISEIIYSMFYIGNIKQHQRAIDIQYLLFISYIFLCV